MKAYGQADDLISENGIDSISMAIRLLEKIENIDKRYEKSSNSLKSIYYELQEISRDICDYKQEIYFDEEERDYIEERKHIVTQAGHENALFLSLQKRRIGVRAVENLVKKFLTFLENILFIELSTNSVYVITLK